MEPTEGRPSEGSGQETPNSDEMNRFVLDLYEEFNQDPGHEFTDFDINSHDEGTPSSEQSNMERFVAMIKFSEKVPQMYREMSVDELRHMILKGLQSRTFVPIVPNAYAGKYHQCCGSVRFCT